MKMENEKIISAVCDELKKVLCKKDAMPLFLVAQNSKGETELMVFNDNIAPGSSERIFARILNFLPCFFANKNSKGEFFIYQDGKYLSIEVEKKNDYYYFKIKN